MLRYTVKYRVPGKFFWKKLQHVIGDGLQNTYRFFTLEDDTQVHVPLHSEIIFSPERMRVIEKNLSKEAGQPIQRT